VFGLLHLGEHRRLEDAQSYVESHRHDDDAEQERYAPAPSQELLLGERREQGEDPGGEQEPYGNPGARQARIEPPLALRGVLRRHDHRAAELRSGP
jgi:hypothetical protein